MLRAIYKFLGQYDGFYTRPPREGRKYYFDADQLVKFNNDGSEVWLGSSDSWSFFCTHEQFRKIIAWYIFQWSVIDLFGLRSFIWYKLLHNEVKKRKNLSSKL